MLRKSSIILSMLFLASVIAGGCNTGGKHRPFGYLRLGKVDSFSESEKLLLKEAILLRHDEKGFFAMSTLCTFDLTPLLLVSGESPLFKSSVPSSSPVSFFRSRVTTSTYNLNGEVTHGPATVNLPYFELELASGGIGEPPNTIYAKIGREVNPSWRLAVKPGTQ